MERRKMLLRALRYHGEHKYQGAVTLWGNKAGNFQIRGAEDVSGKLDVLVNLEGCSLDGATKRFEDIVAVLAGLDKRWRGVQKFDAWYNVAGQKRCDWCLAIFEGKEFIDDYGEYCSAKCQKEGTLELCQQNDFLDRPEDDPCGKGWR